MKWAFFPYPLRTWNNSGWIPIWHGGCWSWSNTGHMPTHTYNPTTAGAAGQTDSTGSQARQTLATLLPGSPPAPGAQAPPDSSPAATQAQGQRATPSTGKMGSHQLYVKLLWNCAIRTGTTWKRKMITLLFLIIQRQIDTTSETLARRYLFPFHNKVKTQEGSEKNQNQHNNKNPPKHKKPKPTKTIPQTSK